MRQVRSAGVLLLVLLVVLLPAAAYSAGTISGKVTHDGAAVAGAVLTVAAPGEPPKTASTNGDGTYSVGGLEASGPFSVSVQAAGLATRSDRDVQPGEHNVALDIATFTPLPVNSGATLTVAGDATSGIFYTAMQGAPELYRTLDHGGTWQPVAMRYEDPDTGLNRSAGGEVVATSSVPGEVAVVTNGRVPAPGGGFLAGGLVHFSTDYGITWRTIQGLLPGHPKTRFLFWGHAGPASQNVVLVAQTDANGSWSVWRANMSAAEPAFVKEPTDPFGQGSVIAAAHSADGSFVGRVTASGELSFARLTAAAAVAFGPTEAAGLPTPPVMLRLGGSREGAAPPDGMLVVGGTGPPYTAQMLTKSSGAATFAGGSLSAPTPVPSICRFLEVLVDLPTGSVAPTAAGDSGSGSVGACWAKKSGNSSLTIGGMSPEDNDVAYDANWGAPGNHVMIQGGSSGPRKFARLRVDGVPDLGGPSIASPGTDPSSGGLSIQGLVSPTVSDTAYGPGGAHQLAVAIFFGQRTLASQDGGQSFAPVVARGSGARQVRWWQGASGQWLLFGHGQSPDERLSAALNWDGALIGPPNVEGSRPEDLGAPGLFLGSLHEVPGTDSVFIGLSHPSGVGGRLYRARIVPGSPPSLVDVFSFDGAFGAIPLYGNQALAYCPSSSADPRVRDVLFVASGQAGGLGFVDEFPGSLLRITGATTATPAVSEVSSVPHGTTRTGVADVRAHCARGVVYAGGSTGILYKSTDGGVTFSPVTLTGPGGTPLTTLGMAISAIGLNPADPNGNDVKVAAGLGMITHSTDGGANWTIINDPETRRPVTVTDIEFPPAGAGPNSVASKAAAPRPGLLGTSGGAFKAELAVSRGLVGVTAAAGGTRRTQTQITALGSDSHPAAAVASATGDSSAVFRRSNGLYHVSTSVGSWSLPIEIKGTVGADFPAAALDPAGGLNVVFARRAPSAGIYVLRREANGVWSAPRRLSSGAGDTLPAIVMASAGAGHIAFLRPRGGSTTPRSRSGRWTVPRKVRGTGVADASPALGGPALDAFAGRVHLALARARQKRGIYYAARRGSRWSVPRRLTRSSDVQPALAVDLKGARHIVFRRASGKRRGLFALRGTKKWTLGRIPGTTARDGEPAVTLPPSGSTIILAFARPSGPVPGIYYDTRTLNGRWLPKPRRWSTSARDRNPSVHSDFRGRLTIVFDRG